jgi:hypothetical protein
MKRIIKIMEDKKYFKKGVEYYYRFGSDTPIKFAESTEPLDSMDAIERSTLNIEIGPWEDSNVSWKKGVKKFMIFAKEKE